MNKFPSDRSANVGTTAFADVSPGNMDRRKGKWLQAVDHCG